MFLERNYLLFFIFAIITGFNVISSDDVKVYMKGEQAILNCTDANGDIKWFKNNETITKSQKIYNFQDASISFIVDKQTLGAYHCSVDDVTISSMDIITAPFPDPENKPEKNAINGETFVYECKFYGYPTPVITWQKAGQPLNMSNPRISSKSTHGLTDNSLKITEVEDEDMGEYACEATNQYGNSTHFIKVNVKDKYAALWPFLGICLEVAVLCTIIFIYERRRNSRTQKEEQKEEADHLTANNDGSRGVEDVRQRK